MTTNRNWDIEIHQTYEGKTIRIFHWGDGGLADKDIEVSDAVLPEIYTWLESRLTLEEHAAKG